MIITDLFVGDKYPHSINDKVLEYFIFRGIEKLSIRSCLLEFHGNLRNLKKLSVCYDSCEIDQKVINHLDLVELIADYNSKIIDVSFMKNLKLLSARGGIHFCGIDQKGISGLNLIELDASYNDSIKDVSFMKNLKYLYVGHFASIIGQEEINGLDLISLVCSNNPRINDVSFMKNLKTLHAEGISGINQDAINGLDLIELSIDNNSRISDISY